MMRHIWGLGCLVFGVASVACAADSPATTEQVQALLARIEQLEKRVAQLEAGENNGGLPAPFAAGQTTAPVPKAPPAPVLEPQTTMTHEQQMRMGESTQAPFASPLLRLSGFGDIDFSATDQRGVKSGFNEGQFVLHTSSTLSPHVSVFSELSLTARADAGLGSTPKWSVFSFASIRATPSRRRLDAITRRSTTGTRLSITAHGCKRPSAAPRWCNSAAASFRSILWAGCWKARRRRAVCT